MKRFPVTEPSIRLQHPCGGCCKVEDSPAQLVVAVAALTVHGQLLILIAKHLRHFALCLQRDIGWIGGDQIESPQLRQEAVLIDQGKTTCDTL